jgi:hypothetical protein
LPESFNRLAPSTRVVTGAASGIGQGARKIQAQARSGRVRHKPNHEMILRFRSTNRRTAPPAATLADNRTFFEKLFGASPQPSEPVLAYAAQEDGVLGNARNLTSSPPRRYDRWTAVYDVAAHTVYLPNGMRLEAHSGLHDRLDDPRHVNERMRGATPPNVYELSVLVFDDPPYKIAVDRTLSQIGLSDRGYA